MPFAAPNISEISELQQSLNTVQFELNYERSSRIVEGVVKDEDIRKLKFKIAVLEDEVEDLNEQLAREEERADILVQDIEDANTRSDDLDAEFQQLMNELRVKSRELETAKAEVAAMSDISNDTAKVLKEKLTLARELSNLKPELEHLRSQVASHQELLSEKLSLQRQLTTVQVELENAQRTAQKATNKAGKSVDRDEEYEAQIEKLQMQLREAKQASKESVTEIDSLKREIALSKKAAERTTAKQDSEEHAGKLQSQLANIRTELSLEKKERQRAEKALEQEKTGWEARKSTLDDKLASFRTKLKSTKEKLRETETELQKAQEASAAQSAAPGQVAKNSRKRQAEEIDPDAAIGTPGDGIPAKRGKRSKATNVGDKSTFSITPFLNRTMSLARESPASGKEDETQKQNGDEDIEDVDAEAGADATPSAVAKKPVKKAAPKTKPKALAPASSAKQNSKPKAKRTKAAIPSLEKVAEEDEVESAKKPAAPSKDVPAKESSENEPEYKEKTTTTKVPTTLVPKLKATSMKQPRKSLLSFAAFNDEPAPEKKKKKKKLLGSSSGLGKTLFDEDDGDKLPAKPIPGRGLFAGKALGKGLLAGKRGLKGPLVTADDGFQFSPLKKDRKAAALAQSMLGD